ncbi:MAG: methionyl-tRNA formyltransferase [Thermodesulfovibrio sp.]|nr:methionyl-tRNA formyltransferase [Thermodesulfovibrio sp.]
MSLIFFGTPEFAVPSLKALIKEKEDIALIITQPDKLKGRGRFLSLPPVKGLALAENIRVLQPGKIKEADFYRELSSIKPEFIIVVAYGKILPEEILGIPASGCINVHASLLPKYRGAAPIQWALINGEKVTGVTTMLMDKGLDTGDILLQAEMEIKDNDNAETLSLRLSNLGAETLIKTINGIRAGTVKPVKQNGDASYAPILKKEDGKIDWSRSAEELFNFVRGMYPWPSAFCYFGRERIKIIKAKPLEGSGVPGRIEKASRSELIVGTGKGVLLIEELQPEGKKTMPAASFIAGRKLKEGHEKFS